MAEDALHALELCKLVYLDASLSMRVLLAKLGVQFGVKAGAISVRFLRLLSNSRNVNVVIKLTLAEFSDFSLFIFVYPWPRITCVAHSRPGGCRSRIRRLGDSTRS